MTVDIPVSLKHRGIKRPVLANATSYLTFLKIPQNAFLLLFLITINRRPDENDWLIETTSDTTVSSNSTLTKKRDDRITPSRPRTRLEKLHPGSLFFPAHQNIYYGEASSLPTRQLIHFSFGISFNLLILQQPRCHFFSTE